VGLRNTRDLIVAHLGHFGAVFCYFGAYPKIELFGGIPKTVFWRPCWDEFGTCLGHAANYIWDRMAWCHAHICTYIGTIHLVRTLFKHTHTHTLRKQIIGTHIASL
jgi:hypothetical protein